MSDILDQESTTSNVASIDKFKKAELKKNSVMCYAPT